MHTVDYNLICEFTATATTAANCGFYGVFISKLLNKIKLHKSFNIMSDDDSDNDQNEFRMSFTSENDFEGGQWIGNEFYFKSQKRVRAQTKEEQIYGVFDHADDELVSKHRSRKRFALSGVQLSDGEKYSKNINFVAGITNMDKTEESFEDQSHSDSDDETDGMEKFSSIIESVVKDETGAKTNSDFRSLFINTSVDNLNGNDKDKIVANDAITSNVSSAAPKVADLAALNNIGKWEKHTKGIGKKLLEKFGFTGRLGAKENGITAAIEVRVRPGTIGIGFGDFNESSSSAANKKVESEWRQKDLKEKSEISYVEKLAESKGWKKSKIKKKNNSKKNEFATPEMLMKMALAKEEQQSQQQIILDMRGEHAKVITDASEINKTPTAISTPQQPKFGEELLFNINLVCDMASMQLHENVRKQKLEKERIESTEIDITKLEAIISKDSDQLSRLEKMVAILDRIKNKLEVSPQDIRISAVAQVFRTMQDNFSSEFTMFGVIHALPSIASPVLRLELQKWEPLSDPTLLVQLLGTWQPLLETLDQTGERTIASRLLEECMESICIPTVRRALTNEWSARDAQPAVALMDALRLVVSTAALEDIVSSVILPKIVSAVSQWSPTTDAVPIHTWLHPWLPLLGSKLSCVYPEIRRKLARALSSWHPSDSSALQVLRPWVRVFDQSSMDQLLVRSIIPKLVGCLRELVIDPQHQDFTLFHQVSFLD